MALEQAKQKARSFMKKALWVLFFLLVVGSTGYYFYRNFTINEGSTTGVLLKISKKGAFFKTYEGELQLAGMQIMNTASKFEFSIQNEEIYRQAQALEGKSVRVYYNQKVDAFPWQGDTDYIVTKVESAEKGN
ncbi:MAG: hypothetical protein H6567_05715 [Lewinellaceae bacterium]|nr:hypothetical protein [Lewinellaceae bacterium]